MTEPMLIRGSIDEPKSTFFRIMENSNQFIDTILEIVSGPNIILITFVRGLESSFLLIEWLLLLENTIQALSIQWIPLKI